MPDMKLSVFSIALLPLFAGCLSSAPKAPTYWTIDRSHFGSAPAAKGRTADAVRIARVDVCAPYNGTRLAVLRPDGSVAFDAFNAFAVAPAALLKNAARDAVSQYGQFKRVLPAASSAKVRYLLDLDVDMLALDCREADKHAVRVELTATLLDGREIVGMATGAAVGRALEADGDYSAAFSSAFFRAVEDALSKLPGK